jgi:hypothetical protein
MKNKIHSLPTTLQKNKFFSKFFHFVLKKIVSLHLINKGGVLLYDSCLLKTSTFSKCIQEISNNSSQLRASLFEYMGCGRPQQRIM